MPPDLRPPVDSTALRDFARQVVVRVLVEVFLNRIIMATAAAHVVVAAAIATQQYLPEEPMLPPPSIPFVFGTQLDEEPLPWPTLAAPPRTIYRIVETQGTVTRSIQDLPLEDELNIAQAELSAERGRTSRLNDELARLEQELTNSNTSNQAAQDALDQLTRERDRLTEQLAEALRPPERERIGSFGGGIMNVYQSPPPEHAYVDEPVRISLFATRRGVNAEDTSWAVTCGTNGSAATHIGGTTGRIFRFRARRPSDCVVTISHEGDQQRYVVTVRNER
jgi:hypothetical protein